MTDQTIRRLFDFQKFADNQQLHSVIEDTQSRYGHALTEEELSYVNAAGVPAMMNVRDSDDKSKESAWKPR